jgi:phospholipid transport system substrate-binding protein
MAKRSLGSHWQRRNPAEQQEFINLFTDLVESSYVDAIDSYDGEKIVVAKEKQDKNFAEVTTKIVTKKGEEYAIDYKLHQTSDSWKIYDAVIEHSLVNNYRPNSTRYRCLYEDLLSKMGEAVRSTGKKL